MKNILITSAGRRVELVRAFQEQASLLLNDSEVHAVDCQPELSPACQIADQYAVCPRALEENYTEYLLNYCHTYKIGLVIPTIDTELQVLAKRKHIFTEQGIVVCISDTALIDSCRDKRKTRELFAKYNVKYPQIYDVNNLSFPCFAKPRGGSCSIGAQTLWNKEALTSDLINDPEMMFMELIDKSYVEYTIDAYFDRHSNLKCFVPRKRIETRAGEVSKGVTRFDDVYHKLTKQMHAIEGAIGCLTIQVFMNESTNDFIGLEINPRFGGGFPLAYAAGANYPGWLIKEYLLDEEIPFYDEWERNLLMLRHDAQVLVYDSGF